MKFEYITIDDKEYPDRLKNIEDAPEKLWFSGDISLLKTDCIAIVGTRRCSPYGRWAAFEIGKSIAGCGVTIVSGMAEGIDTQGHQGALYSGGRTIAVLGSRINVCFPKSNEKLFEKLSSEELIISEYGPEDLTGNWSFPQRNRIISGLSKAVVVVEGTHKSGSMITANYAIAQSRELYAVPGNINNPNAAGTNFLIKDGAVPITSIQEVPKILGLNELYRQSVVNGLNIFEAKIYECASIAPGLELELVAEKLKLPIVDTLRYCSKMELKGLIKIEENCLFLNL